MESSLEKDLNQMIRKIPAVHSLVSDEQLRYLAESQGISKEQLTAIVKDVNASIREQILHQGRKEISRESVIEAVRAELRSYGSRRLRRVINGTGVVLHTNLGRAVLAEETLESIRDISLSYSNLEYRLEEGTRGSRHDHVEALVTRLTGAEAAMVVNNNAAAVFIILHELAKDKEVVVSRGQLVEIGGSFRVSEIMEESGAILREVGTTNKTRLQDYERALSSQTALLLKVHTSNFQITGFTESVSIQQLVSLGKMHEIPVYEDLGSGVLYDLQSHGIGNEPLISDSIHCGADLVSFSGDKLLGGPQAGIIAGRKEWINRLKKNQLARVLRVDKITLAALEATLRLYLDPEKAVQHIPTLRDLTMPLEEVRQKAEMFRDMLKDFKILLQEDKTEAGGGSLPGVEIPTVTAVIEDPRYPAHVIDRLLRQAAPAVIGRVHKDRFLLDFRTIQVNEVKELVHIIRETLV